MLGKYETIVILSTLGEPKSIVEISTAWFGNKGRLYQGAIRKEINRSIKQGYLHHVGRAKVKADTNRFIRELMPHITPIGSESPAAREYRDLLTKFYINLGEYTQRVYLNFGVIKTLCLEGGRLSPHKGNDLDLALLVQLPFLLRYLERKYPEANYLIQALRLEDYEIIIDTLEFEYRTILRQHAWENAWADYFLKAEELIPKMQKKSVGLLAKSLEAMRTLGST